ncbi:MAG: 50S ribosome-binding GTPase [Caldilineaceae bacterium]|nr:50S ribosome-binding GTPase [Caldilineaceae bacterium]
MVTYNRAQQAIPTVVLVGLESVGKSALFRNLTGEAPGDEANFRGSTVRVHRARLAGGAHDLVDTPGIRVRDDRMTARLALQQLRCADTVLLVARGTHISQELDTLMESVGSELAGRRVALVITFEDKAPAALAILARTAEHRYGIPTAVVNARNMNPAQHEQLRRVIEQAALLDFAPDHRQPIALLEVASVAQPEQTLFEHAWVGPWLALAALALLFVLPVYLAYHFADWAQPLLDAWLITPMVTRLEPLTSAAPLLYALLAGDYGLLTLGWYSFLWAFPVVLLIGVGVALAEESGLKDRITAALDPWLRRIGLSGRDLIPVLSGFGCNVVAVFQSRSCSACTRKACVSLIAFGSACSYQIGASLSIFNAAGAPWLFAPYLGALFVVGAIHTRFWHGKLANAGALPLAERAFLQQPTMRAAQWKVRTVLRQFLREAMPIFLLICLVGALLDYGGVTAWLSNVTAPILRILHLPAEAAPGVVFSIIRKDGLLAVNLGEGALIQAMSPGQIFTLVYLASTLTACLVTLWTIRAELGWRAALAVAGRQAATSLISALLLSQLGQFTISR